MSRESWKATPTGSARQPNFRHFCLECVGVIQSKLSSVTGELGAEVAFTLSRIFGPKSSWLLGCEGGTRRGEKPQIPAVTPPRSRAALWGVPSCPLWGGSLTCRGAPLGAPPACGVRRRSPPRGTAPKRGKAVKNPWEGGSESWVGGVGVPPLNPMQISPLVCLCSRQR